MNWIELVQANWPGIDDQGAHEILWNATCFPMGDAEMISKQVRDVYEKSGGNISLAIALVEDEMFEEFKRHKVMEILKNG